MKQIIFILAVLLPGFCFSQNHHTKSPLRYHYYPEKIEYWDGIRIRPCDSCWVAYIKRSNKPDTTRYFDEKKNPIPIKPVWVKSTDWRRRLTMEGDPMKKARDSLKITKWKP